MRLLIVLVIVFTFLIGGAFNAFILDRIDAGILRNQTWHYGASPHNRRINTELTSNPNRLEVVRHQMRAWTPMIMGVAPNATGQNIWQQVTTDGLYFGATNLADAQPEHAFQTDVVWEHQGLRPTTGDWFNHYMTAFPTSDNQDLMLFNVGYQGNRFGHSVRIVTDPDFLQYLQLLENYQMIEYDWGNGMLGPHPEVTRLTNILQEHSELVTVHTMHFNPANFTLWVSAEEVGIYQTKHDQAVLSLMNFLENMESSMVSAINRVDNVQGAERAFANAALDIQRLFNNTPGTDHAGFRAASTFAQSLGSQSNEFINQNFNSPFTNNGQTPMSLAQEFDWIWAQINSLGLDEQTARRVMFIIMASTAIEVDASYSRQINSRMRIHSSNRRSFWHWVGDSGGAPGQPPYRRGQQGQSRYDNWAEAVSERLQHSFGDTYSPMSRFATFVPLHNSSLTQNDSMLNQALYHAVRDQRGGDVHSFLVPTSMVEIHLDTVFVIYHLVMGNQGRFTVNGQRLEYIRRNHNTSTIDNQDAQARFFVYATQSNHGVRTSGGSSSSERDTRFLIFGEVSPRNSNTDLSGTLWFNQELTNRGRNQRLHNNVRAGLSVADMFEDSVFGMHRIPRREIRDVITNNELFQHFNLTASGRPVIAWANYQERVASLHFSQIRLGFVPGHRGGNVLFTYPVFASGRPMALSFAATAEHIYNTEEVSFFTAGVNAHLVFWGHNLEEQRNIFSGQTGAHMTNSARVDRLARFRGREPIHISGYWLPAHQPGSNRFSRLTWAEVIAGQGNHANHLPLWQAMFGVNPPVNPPLEWHLFPEWWDSLDEAERQRQRQLGFDYDLIRLIGYTPMPEDTPNLGDAYATPY